MLKETQEVVCLYESRGFEVVDIQADMEFKCLKNNVCPVELNVTTNDDHVGEVECSVRTIKKRVRADVQTLPFKRLPKIMILGVVRKAVQLLNQFPAMDGIYDTLSPLTRHHHDREAESRL